MYRHDRSHKRGGGVAVDVRDTIPHHTWPELQDPEFESLWITLRPLRMPRIFSHITIAVLYHPPNANSWQMSNHVSKCLDTVLHKHPSSGTVITGDMNHLKDSYIKSSFSLKQIVTKATRGSRILDKVYTNMSSIYRTPIIDPQIGRSDHNGVLCRPSPDYTDLCTAPVTRTTRVNGKNERVLFASALMDINWDPLYHMQCCSEQFLFFQAKMQDLLDTFCL